MMQENSLPVVLNNFNPYLHPNYPFEKHGTQHGPLSSTPSVNFLIKNYSSNIFPLLSTYKIGWSQSADKFSWLYTARR